ncbi:hypothetical protein V8F20_009639 [Naviculisporaceae sp. PSN 640]
MSSLLEYRWLIAWGALHFYRVSLKGEILQCSSSNEPSAIDKISIRTRRWLWRELYSGWIIDMRAREVRAKYRGREDSIKASDCTDERLILLQGEPDQETYRKFATRGLRPVHMYCVVRTMETFLLQYHHAAGLNIPFVHMISHWWSRAEVPERYGMRSQSPPQVLIFGIYRVFETALVQQFRLCGSVTSVLAPIVTGLPYQKARHAVRNGCHDHFSPSFPPPSSPASTHPKVSIPLQ